MRELTKVPNLMARPVDAGLDPRRAVATAQAAAKLAPALEAAKAFAAQVRPDVQRPVSRRDPEVQRALARIVTRPLMTGRSPFQQLQFSRIPADE
jgi:hypothetical protein